MAAETSLLSKYLSTPKHLEHLHAFAKKTFTFHRKTDCIILLTILVITTLGDITPLCFIRQSVYFCFPNTTAVASGRAV